MQVIRVGTILKIANRTIFFDILKMLISTYCTNQIMMVMKDFACQWSKKKDQQN